MSSSAPPADGAERDLDDRRRGTGDAEGIIEAIDRAEPRADNLEDCPHVEPPVNPVDHQLPAPGPGNDHALPGFGEPYDDCGEFVPEAMFYCPECLEIHEKRRICYRLDCPQHAPHAIRRWAAGLESSDSLGAAAKLGGLRAYLDSIRPHRQYYQGLFISPPPGEGWFTESGKPLQRTFDVIGEILELAGGEGIEGLVTYHPCRGINEEPGEDDRGEWKKRLFSDREWEGDVERELRYEPHFHVRGVGYFDLSITEAIEEATGWVIHRSEAWLNTNGEVTDEMVAAAIQYDRSHGLVYTTEDGQRRLAARWKGKHLQDVTYNENEARWRQDVYATAVDTLGIAPPEMECDREIKTSTSRSAPFMPEPSPARSSSGAGSGSGTSGSSTPSANSAAASSSTETETEPCGGRLRHISTAGDVLPELIDREGADAGDLDAAYRSYVRYMEAKGLDPTEDPRAAPELADRPPPDELPI